MTGSGERAGRVRSDGAVGVRAASGARGGGVALDVVVGLPDHNRIAVDLLLSQSPLLLRTVGLFLAPLNGNLKAPPPKANP